MQTSAFRGSLTVTSFRLCSRAPWTISSSAAIAGQCNGGFSLEQVFASAPGPVARTLAEAGANRVVEDVVDRVLQVLFGVDDPACEPVAEDVPPAPMSAVEVLRVDAVDPPQDRKSVV